ncbi:phage tail protein [Escherichia coli]
MTNALAGKQPLDATLTALAGLPTGANKLPYFTGKDTVAQTDLTPVGRDILAKSSTQAIIQYLGLGEGSALPVGVPVPWPSATPPTGWLKCNGAPFSAEEYPELAKAYPTNKLPDLRGEFIRGWDDGRGIDSGRGILTAQSHGMPSISATFNGLYAAQITNTQGCASVKKSVNPENVSTYYDTGSMFDYTLDTSGLIPASPELRPRNIAFNYIVRAA